MGALVDAVAPGLCPDWPDWNPKDALQNASEAMGLADDWLNVRQVRLSLWSFSPFLILSRVPFMGLYAIHLYEC